MGHRLSGAALSAALCSLLLCACKREAPTPPPATASPAAARPPAPQALHTAQEYVRKNPKDPGGYVRLARALPRNQVPQAAKALRTALKLDPRSQEAYQELFGLYGAFGYTDRQLELVEARCKAVPEDTAALLQAADLYQSIGLPLQAGTILEAAMRQGPATIPVVKARALWLYRQLRHREGIQLLQQAIQRVPNEPELHYQLSELQRAQGLFDDAEKSIRHALARKPESAPYNRQLAHILVTMKQPARLAEAETVARKAVGLDSKDIDARYWLAQAVDKQEKAEEAMRLYAEISKEDIRYENVAYRLGQLYRSQGRAKEGTGLMGFYSLINNNQKKLGQAVETLQKRPGDPAAYLPVAELYGRAEEHGTAVALLRVAHRRFPADKKVRKALRAALLKAGRKTEAEAVG